MVIYILYTYYRPFPQPVFLNCFCYIENKITHIRDIIISSLFIKKMMTFCSFHVAISLRVFFLQIKRFQRYLSKCSAADTEKRAENVPTSFSFRKSNLKERLAMRLRSFFGHGDPKDFFMIKFYDWIYKFPIPIFQSKNLLSLPFFTKIDYCCHFYMYL